jgi:competence protein ComGC
MKKIIIVLLGMSVMLMAQRPDMFEEKRNIEAMRIYRLIDVLDLSDSQVDAFIPALKKHDKKIKELRDSKADAIRDGRKLYDEESLSQKQVDKLFQTLNKIDSDINQERQKFIASLSKYLDPKQQLKYIGFDQRFRNEVGKFLRGREDFNQQRDDFNRKKRK